MLQRQPIRVTATGRLLSAAVVIAGFAFSAPVLGQSAGSTLSIGVSAGGVISDIFVHAGSRVHAGDALVKLNCQPLEADLRSRQAQLHAAQATFDKVKNGPRPDEIKVGEAIVGYSQARAEEAQKTLDRTQELQEGVTVTTARVLEVKRDSRIADAQLEEAKARLSLLQAGSREEDIRQSEALRDAAAAELDSTRARLDLCTVHAPVDGVVTDIPVNVGQYVSVAVPQVLLHLTQDPTH